MNKIEFFCFWECGKIGINITRDKELIPVDLTLEEAKIVRSQLYSAIEQYENLEREIDNYTKK